MLIFLGMPVFAIAESEVNHIIFDILGFLGAWYEAGEAGTVGGRI